jgi:hypothetical protein
VQWIEIDLGQERSVELVRLLVAQDPPGGTSHIVSARGESGDWHEIAILTGDTSDGQWLEVPLAEPLEGIRYIGVETVTSPSWVAWREISILGK